MSAAMSGGISAYNELSKGFDNAYAGGFIAGYGNSSSTSLDDELNKTTTSTLDLAVGGIIGAWGYGYSNSKIQSENGKAKYLMKGYKVNAN